MTKGEFIAKVQENVEELGLSKKAVGEIIDAVFESAAEVVKDDGRFAYPGFGVFTLKERKAREGINPRNREKIKIPAKKTIVFKPSASLKESL